MSLILELAELKKCRKLYDGIHDKDLSSNEIHSKISQIIKILKESELKNFLSQFYSNPPQTIKLHEGEPSTFWYDDYRHEEENAFNNRIMHIFQYQQDTSSQIYDDLDDILNSLRYPPIERMIEN